jgi:hypothetical protein
MLCINLYLKIFLIRPGSWSPDKAVDKKLKDQNPTLCEKCPNKNTCSYGLLQESDPHKAALSCLQQGGDVAYVDQSYAGDFINVCMKNQFKIQEI